MTTATLLGVEGFRALCASLYFASHAPASGKNLQNQSLELREGMKDLPERSMESHAVTGAPFPLTDGSSLPGFARDPQRKFKSSRLSYRTFFKQCRQKVSVSRALSTGCLQEGLVFRPYVVLPKGSSKFENQYSKFESQ